MASKIITRQNAHSASHFLTVIMHHQLRVLNMSLDLEVDKIFAFSISVVNMASN